MALVSNGIDVSAVKDKPSAFSQTPIVGVSGDYVKAYPISIDKATVDTTGTPDTNFTALVAAVDVAVQALVGADFDDTLNTVTMAGRITSFNLGGGSKYINTVNTSSYEANVEVDIAVVII